MKLIPHFFVLLIVGCNVFAEANPDININIHINGDEPETGRRCNKLSTAGCNTVGTTSAPPNTAKTTLPWRTTATAPTTTNDSPLIWTTAGWTTPRSNTTAPETTASSEAQTTVPMSSITPSPALVAYAASEGYSLADLMNEPPGYLPALQQAFDEGDLPN